MHKNLNKVTHHPKTITQEELEKRLKKASEAKEELSSWQYERR